MGDIIAGEYGKPMYFTIKDKLSLSAEDLSDITTITIYFENPAGTITTKTGSWYTDGSDGIVEWTITNGTFTNSNIGDWKVEIKLIKSGVVEKTFKGRFTVLESLET